MTSPPSTEAAEHIARLTAPGAPYEMDQVPGGWRRSWAGGPKTLVDIVAMGAGHGDLPFLILGDIQWTYRDHADAVAALAHFLRHEVGVQPGDRVAIAMRNLPEWSATFWATVCIGAVAVPLNAWWTGAELAFGLSDSGAAVVVADEERISRLDGLIPDSVRQLVVGQSLAKVLDQYRGNQLPVVPVEPDMDATMFYTSGTTGRPKAAIGTHLNMATNLLSRQFFRDLHASLYGTSPSAPGPTLLTVPLFHVTGSHSYLLTALASGVPLVMMNRWNVHDALTLIEKHRIVAMGGVPFMALQLADAYDPNQHDLSSLRSVAFGGASAPPSLPGRLHALLPGALSGNGFGMTETSSVAIYNFGRDLLARPESIGRVVPVMDAQVVDEEGRVLPPGEVGELWMRGPNVVRGYWQRPDETASTFMADGWIRTGDIVSIGLDDMVTIVDRKKEIIMRGGENIAPAEVEAALITHPAVLDAAVVGLPHETLGEQVAAMVQVRSAAAGMADELRRYVGGQIAGYKVPVQIHVTEDPLPRNAQGKLVKTQVRAALS